MRYEEPTPIMRAEAEAAFSCDNPATVCNALVRVTFHDPDWRWVQEKCLLFARHSSPEIRGLAVTCFGHIARIHRVLDMEKVLPVLESLLKDPEIGGRAEDALDDIDTYVGFKPK